MENLTELCPKCRSGYIAFSPKAKKYRCEDCGEMFDKPLTVEPVRKNTITTNHIKVFLASSIKLTAERDLISSVVAESNGKDHHTYVELNRCEYDNRIQMNGTQQEMYDQWISESNVFILIVSGGGIGEWTEKEIAIAAEMKEKRGTKLYALVQIGAESCDTAEGKRWRKAFSTYGGAFDLLKEYSDLSELYDRARELVDEIRSKVTGTLIENCLRIGYDIVITGISDRSREFVYSLADKFNRKNNENFCENNRESLLFTLKLIVNDPDDLEEYMVGVNDYYFILAGRNEDLKNRIGECYRMKSGNPFTFFDVSVFEEDSESARIMEEISKEINGNYLSTFINREALIGKNAVNNRMEEIKRAYRRFLAGLSYYEMGNFFGAEDPLIEAAKFGFKDAYFYLGCIYNDESKPDFFNRDKAVENYRAAADGGHADAQFNLANMLAESDPKQAEKYYRMAARQNYPAAYYNLGVMFYHMGELSRAEGCMRNAIDAKITQAKYFLPRILEENGNDSDAYHYLRLAAENDPEGQYRLGVFLTKPKNAPYIKEAEDYLRAAADKGHVGAQKALAELLERRKEPEEAEKYFRMAENREYKELVPDILIENTAETSTEAEREREAIGKRGYRNIPELEEAYRLEKEGKKEEANKHYRLAAETRSPEVLFKVGSHFLEEDNTDEAEKYFRLCAVSGFESALPSDKVDIALSIYQLITIFAKDGNAEEAEKYYRLALSAVSDRSDENYFTIKNILISALNALTDIYTEKGNNAKAEKLLRMVIDTAADDYLAAMAKKMLCKLLAPGNESMLAEMTSLCEELQRLMTENKELQNSMDDTLLQKGSAEKNIDDELQKNEERQYLIERNCTKMNELYEKYNALKEKLVKSIAEVNSMAQDVERFNAKLGDDSQ